MKLNRRLCSSIMRKTSFLSSVSLKILGTLKNIFFSEIVTENSQSSATLMEKGLKAKIKRLNASKTVYKELRIW